MRRLKLRLPWRAAPAGRRRPLPRWLRRSLLVLCLATAVTAYAATVMHLSRNGWVDERWQAAVAWAEGQTRAAGFRLASVRVHGADRTEAAALRTALAVPSGASLLALDLEAAQRRVEGLAWVRAASVERVLPDRLVVRVLERQPIALWQREGRLRLIDSTGAAIPGAMLSPFAELPTVTGPGAPQAAPALLGLLADAPDLARRVTAAALRGGRRWDVRVDDRVWVRLPEDDARDAWLRLAGLEAKHKLLSRDILAADLRNQEQWAFRLPPGMRLRMTLQENGS